MREGERGTERQANSHRENSNSNHITLREWKSSDYNSRQTKTFPVFVDNPPINLDPYGLRGIFKRAGNIKEIYIPNKPSHRIPRYGFVHFEKDMEAARRIRMLNNFGVRGMRLRVSIAKERRRPRQQQHQLNWRKNQHQFRQEMNRPRSVWIRKNFEEEREKDDNSVRRPQKEEQMSKLASGWNIVSYVKTRNPWKFTFLKNNFPLSTGKSPRFSP